MWSQNSFIGVEGGCQTSKQYIECNNDLNNVIFKDLRLEY